MNRAVFLDRDGTLIKDVHYLKDPEQIEIIEGVGCSLDTIKKSGFGIFMHTNQSGITRGYYGWEDVRACNHRMLQMLNLPEDFFDQVCIAPEDRFVPGGLRKPSPKFELEMISRYDLMPRRCWMVGDKWIDAETGLNAGMRAALVQTGKPLDDDLLDRAASLSVEVFTGLEQFVGHLLETIDE